MIQACSLLRFRQQLEERGLGRGDVLRHAAPHPGGFHTGQRARLGALNQLRIPGFAETNLFDALYDTLDRLDRLEGQSM